MTKGSDECHSPSSAFVSARCSYHSQRLRERPMTALDLAANLTLKRNLQLVIEALSDHAKCCGELCLIGERRRT